MNSRETKEYTKAFNQTQQSQSRARLISELQHAPHKQYMRKAAAEWQRVIFIAGNLLKPETVSLGSNISIVAQKEWSKDHARIQLVRQNPERKQSQAFKNVQDAEPFASKALDTWEASQKERSHHVALLTTEPQRVPPSSDVRRELPSPWVNLGGKEGPSAGAPEVLTGSLRSTFMRGDQRYPPWSQ